MKKILYVLTSLSHKRCYESFVERNDCAQMIAGLKPVITQKIIPEDYSDFNIKNIKFYSNKKDLQGIVNSFRPDIYVQASIPCADGIKLPSGCKKVYLSHGLIGNHVKGIVKSLPGSVPKWRGCDLYCGGTKIFEDWIKYSAKCSSSKILLNAVPQFDLIKSPNYYNSYRDEIISNSRNPHASKVILFAGFCCRERDDFKAHNEDYFKTVIELERLAMKHNWLVMVKPRQYYPKMMKFLKAQKWGNKYYKKYAEIQKSKYLHFITTTGHIYRYFFADIFVLNGCSTIEIEACIAQKPLIAVRTNKLITKDTYDPYNTVSFGAAHEIKRIESLEGCLLNVDFGDKLVKQKQLIDNMKLTIDGKMHERIQNKLRDL